ncbi:hypothetical protein FK498_10975 [Elioraea sp. Yellowstone]|uniref:hypothetical protein n=1 Tax=Elioraea sp. Yellowstone TaxID=2592070 RepID=UPI00114D5895|nr:hypothetical protein [Elioraea sp. Yellowstone]TQF77835.1 hypothetical protein FK498_10975 [Elioraea sp. Yellowstone]
MIRLVLLGLVLAGVWYLYRMVTQQGTSTAAVPPPEPANDAAPPEAEAEAEEMAECPVCRAYLPVSAHEGCGRPDCPIPAVAAAVAEEGEPPAGEPPPEGAPKPG